jgi:hypothetical protein
VTIGDIGHQKAPFDTVIAMAEAAHCGNISWWNQIRVDSADGTETEYLASRMLARLIAAAAHRQGIPTADVWARIRETGNLPL